MDITIKTVRGVIVTNLIIFGLAACSSSPAPWTRADESPWGGKYASEAENVPSDEAISDITLDEPVLLSDPEPELMLIQEPEPEVIAPVLVVDMTAEQEIMAMSPSDYAVQVYASNTLHSIEKFRNSRYLNDLKIVKTNRSGSIVYVLVDVYPDRSTANEAAPDLEVKTGSKPWVRSLAGLQKIVAQ